MEERELLTFDEVKEYLKVNRSTLYKFVQEGKIPAVKLGRQWRFDISEINGWLKQQSLEYKSNRRKQAETYKAEEGDGSKRTIEKRRFFRLVKKFQVRYSLIENPEKIFKATGRNISEGGIFIETELLEHQFLSSIKTKKRKLRLVIELPEKGGIIEVCSETVWIEEQTPQLNKINIGLEFKDLSQETKSTISSYIIGQNRLQTELSQLRKSPLIQIESFPVRIESSVIVKRPKEEVYRFLKNLEQFPEFMRNVKYISMLNGRGNRIITEWEIYFGGTTLTWKEEDIFDDKKMTIRFKMIEGDFGRYEGEWQLFSLLTGTEIRLTIIVDWGLSVLNKHTQSDLEELTQERVQDMLSALKKEMWVNKVTALSKFACVIHPLDISLVTAYDKNVQRKRESVLRKILERMPPFWTSYIKGVKSLTGKEIEGEFVMCPLLPDQILGLNNNVVLQKIIEAGKIAEEREAKIFGLAAYTANVGRKGILVANALNIPVTTGTSYTIATAIEATLKAAEDIGIELHQAKGVIIGATGSIGSICSQTLAERVAALTLVARNRERLDKFADFLRNNSVATIKTSRIIDRFLFRDTNIVIIATNTPTALIDIDFLPPGIIVCDMSLPKNITEEAANSRKDILVIDGGVVKPPGDVDFNFYFGLPPGLCYACIAETMILALEERYECYSIGGNISFAKVREISQLASKHGVKLAELRSFGKEVSKEHIEEVKQKGQI